MGVTAETIDNGEDGKVLWFGRIRGINTNAYNEGDILYASTTSAGGFQTTLPVAPNNIVEVCAVVTKSINNGVIFVRPQFLSSASIGGSGTTNYVPRFTGSTTIGNSQIIDNGTNVLVNKTSDSGQKFQVNGTGLFSNSLEIAGSIAVLRVRTDANIANIAYIKDNFEEAVSLKFDDSANEFAIITNVENYPIRIQPHGTGNIKIPNVPTGTGDVLARDSSNNLVRIPTFAPYKLLDEDITPSAFTLNSFNSILTGGLLGTNSFSGGTNSSYGGELLLRSVDSDINTGCTVRFVFFSQNIDFSINLGSSLNIERIISIKFRIIIQSGNFLIFGQCYLPDASFDEYVTPLNSALTTYTASGTSSLDVQVKVLPDVTIYPVSLVLTQNL
jgi:hypothetical protein